ncbi:MAG: PadR family transcriptional regulator [Candidatus Promineifilaceae bacterium]
MEIRDQIRKGSTTLLILALLSEEPMYGYQISQELEQRSGGYFEMKEGLLYPLLHRMKREGLVSSKGQEASGARRRKYYAITAEGKQALKEQTQEWEMFMNKLQGVLAGVTP